MCSRAAGDAIPHCDAMYEPHFATVQRHMEYYMVSKMMDACRWMDVTVGPWMEIVQGVSNLSHPNWVPSRLTHRPHPPISAATPPTEPQHPHTTTSVKDFLGLDNIVHRSPLLQSSDDSFASRVSSATGLPRFQLIEPIGDPSSSDVAHQQLLPTLDSTLSLQLPLRSPNGSD